mmetsp:Transcript_9498/g.23310  ORF Transcript_9498/g.23310 Transcript_9498/m.23310 type:complete len:581 (-) Transcript_9498:1055-2797(-)
MLTTFFERRHGSVSLIAVTTFIAKIVLIIHLYSSFESKRLIEFTTASAGTISTKKQFPYRLLATVIQEKLFEENDDEQFRNGSKEPPTTLELTKIISSLANNQQAFKGFDGMAHEVYQRTHSGDDITDTSVSGRAQRSASRLAAVSEALYACELVEIAEHPELLLRDGDEDDGILHDKEFILNVTLGDEKAVSEGGSTTKSDFVLSVIVIFEPHYAGGTGLEHGNLVSLTQTSHKPSNLNTEAEENKVHKGGRLVIVLGHKSSLSTAQRVGILDEKPKRIKLSSGLVTNEVASVQSELYRKAGDLLTLLEPQLRQYNTSSYHFVGHSLAGGVASLAATILDGSIPMPKKRTKQQPRKPKRQKRSKKAETNDAMMSESSSEGTGSVMESNEKRDDEEKAIPVEPLNGLGRSRSSALTLGTPPCLSSNVLGAFCTSFIYGDDIVCRTTEDSISRLVKRIEKNIHGGFIAKNLGWMSDTMSMTVSGLQNHAHGSEGEEAKLSIPGRAFLVRPRRLGGICSIHEVGNLKKGGREALREALLWQMNDVLLSTSMWKHHDLTAYISGLDRTQLRGVVDEGSQLDLE